MACKSYVSDTSTPGCRSLGTDEAACAIRCNVIRPSQSHTKTDVATSRRRARGIPVRCYGSSVGFRAGHLLLVLWLRSLFVGWFERIGDPIRPSFQKGDGSFLSRRTDRESPGTWCHPWLPALHDLHGCGCLVHQGQHQELTCKGCLE